MNDALDGLSPDEPVHGYKVGVVYWLGDGTLRLSGVGGPPDGRDGDRMYDVDDSARCARGMRHVAPEPECTCGFWSVLDRSDLGRAFSRVDQRWVDLEVESFGRMVVHEHGLRSERQRVLSVTFDDRCVECGRQATVLGADKPEAVTPRCVMHAPSARTGYCELPSDAAGRLGTEVRFGRRTWTAAASASARPASRSRSRWRALQVVPLVTIALLVTTLVVLVTRSTTLAPSTIPAADASSTLATDQLVSIAQRAAAGEDLTVWIVTGEQRSAVQRITVGTAVTGVAVLTIAGDGSSSCAIAVQDPVPAFADALLADSSLSGPWRIARRNPSSAVDCLSWHDDVERVLAGTTSTTR